MPNKSLIILAVLTALSLLIHLFMWNKSPPCLSVDEAAYGYNAYSILKTARDEFGKLLPLRLQSFGDFKLPMYSYITIPFVMALGLNEFSTRLPAYLAAMGLILVMYVLIKKMFNNENQAIISAGMVTLSPWINTISRHAHEVVVATFFITLGIYFFICYAKRRVFRDAIFSIILFGIALYTYHIARLFVGIFTVALFYITFFQFKESSVKKIFLTMGTLLIFLPFIFAEIAQPPSRIGNLLLTKNEGINLRAKELTTEFRYSLFSTKLFVTFDEFFKRYTDYFSPYFLVQKGDATLRFGFPDSIHPITHVEYVLAVIGLFILFRKNKRIALFLLFLTLISPLPAALTWQEYALTRAFFLIIPLLILIGYAVQQIVDSSSKYKLFILGICLLMYGVYTAMSWDFFYFHYPKRGAVVRSWFCGYKEVASFVKNNYSKYDRFYITQEIGQPYIALLFYLRYNPAMYQKQVSLLPPDGYGYTKISNFDKFIFNIDSFEKRKKENAVYIFSESEAKNRNIKPDDALRIKIWTEDMFWIYTPKSISNHSKTPV